LESYLQKAESWMADFYGSANRALTPSRIAGFLAGSDLGEGFTPESEQLLIEDFWKDVEKILK